MRSRGESPDGDRSRYGGSRNDALTGETENCAEFVIICADHNRRTQVMSDACNDKRCSKWLPSGFVTRR